MGLLARLFGRTPPPRRPEVVRWQEHPYTKTLAYWAYRLLEEAKELKRKRERVGRSADYWQGKIDALTEIRRLAHGSGLWEHGQIKCYRGSCLVCGADEFAPCDLEKHKQ